MELPNHKEFMFKCPECGKANWRDYIPMKHVTCQECKTNFIREPDALVESWQRVLDDVSFKTRMNRICDRFTPVTAFIYPGFAVFGFKEYIDCFNFKKTTAIESSVFRELEVINLGDRCAVVDANYKEGGSNA